jgi:hypothetical protein
MHESGFLDDNPSLANLSELLKRAVGALSLEGIKWK